MGALSHKSQGILDAVETDDDRLAELILAPRLLNAVREQTISEHATRINAQAWSLEVLNPECCTILLNQPRPPGHKCLLNTGDSVTVKIGTFIARWLLPKLQPLAAEHHAGLCEQRLSYMLHYTQQHAEASWRVRKCHVDDSDITLSTCIGVHGGWEGADLVYATSCTPNARPVTPNLDDPNTRIVTHTHQPGVGVLHTGAAYHMVTPLQSGERLSLVCMAFEDNALWKHEYYRDQGNS